MAKVMTKPSLNRWTTGYENSSGGMVRLRHMKNTFTGIDDTIYKSPKHNILTTVCHIWCKCPNSRSVI